MVLTRGVEIAAEALPPEVQAAASGNGQNDQGGGGDSLDVPLNRRASDREDFTRPLAERIEQIIEMEEKRIILAALARMNGHREKTADLLGISRKSLHNKMAKYDLFEKEESTL
jgi:DNA-binding NtrC family response regulator